MTESGEYARYNGVLGLYVSNNDRQRDGQRPTERVKGMKKRKEKNARNAENRMQHFL